MRYMLCRNRVGDFARWKAIFSSHQKAHQNAGLRLMKLWRDLQDTNNVFFLFELESLEKAQEFISDPAATEAAKASGVIEGEYHILADAGGY